jgi:hypothetical protein
MYRGMLAGTGIGLILLGLFFLLGKWVAFAAAFVVWLLHPIFWSLRRK